MKKRSIMIILLSLLCLTSCNNQGKHVSYNLELMSYMTSKPASYYGESDYYHEIQKIEQQALNNQRLVVASGEIKDNSIGNTRVDYSFNYQFLVTDQSVFQTLDNNRLNDSNFREIELLRLPLEMGNIWTFDAVMFNNKTTKMTAEIMYVSDSLDEIKVKYTAKDYSAFRVFKKELGVTDFIKEVAYKDVKAISGFHLEQDEDTPETDLSKSEAEVNEIQNEESIFSDISEVATHQEEYDLILGFNQNYEKKIRLEDQKLTEYVMPESPASEKINGLKAVDVGTFNFIKFKIESRLETDDAVILEVVEMYDLGDNQSIMNTVKYTLKDYGDHLMIYNFE